MTSQSQPSDQIKLPPPLAGDSFQLLRSGVYDDDAMQVFVNMQQDFAFLDPLPTTDYHQYKPRSASLGLTHYKKNRRVLQDRWNKISSYLEGAESFLEIGAADGGFLSIVGNRVPGSILVAVEPDEATSAARNAAGIKHFSTTADARIAGCRVQCVGMFHVFEHLLDPRPMLTDIQDLLLPGGKLLVEVPSLYDPLLSVFSCAPYADFYFQRQHPFVYTGASLGRVLQEAGFLVIDTLAYQRYGLENHLQWLNAGEPGGNTKLRELFHSVDGDYRAALETAGRTDTVVVVATPQ